MSWIGCLTPPIIAHKTKHSNIDFFFIKQLLPLFLYECPWYRNHLINGWMPNFANVAHAWVSEIEGCGPSTCLPPATLAASLYHIFFLAHSLRHKFLMCGGVWLRGEQCGIARWVRSSNGSYLAHPLHPLSVASIRRDQKTSFIHIISYSLNIPMKISATSTAIAVLFVSSYSTVSAGDHHSSRPNPQCTGALLTKVVNNQYVPFTNQQCVFSPPPNVGLCCADSQNGQANPRKVDASQRADGMCNFCFTSYQGL